MITDKRILIVDDDAPFLEMLSKQFQLHDEFAIVTAETGAESLDLAKADHYDVIILDVGLPDIDGREICRLMRRDGVTSPVIMLTGADSDADTILGLDAGANDYVVKPFNLGILLARIRAQIRLHERSADAVLIIGPYTFRPSAKLLVNNKDNRKVHLAEKEMAILTYLYRAGGKVVSRDVLLDKVWGYNARVTTHTLETHVYRLRQKIETDPSSPQILITEPGGYRLAP